METRRENVVVAQVETSVPWPVFWSAIWVGALAAGALALPLGLVVCGAVNQKSSLCGGPSRDLGAVARFLECHLGGSAGCRRAGLTLRLGRDCAGLSPAGTESADCRLAQIWGGGADFQCVRRVFFRGGGRLGPWQDRREPALGTCHAPWGERLARHRAPAARLRGDGGEQLLRRLVWRIWRAGGFGAPPARAA